jgi:YbbR domain-containing protein
MAYHPFRHLGLKVLAISLATLLWLTVAGEHVGERSLRVPLEFRNIPSQLEISGDPPESVDVRVRGSSALLSRLGPGEVVAVLDLSSARPGSRLFSIRTDEVRAPYGVEVAQVVPGTLSLDVARSASRVVPIVPAVDGEPASGFVIGRIVPEPATVQVVGPESRLRQLSEATTETINVEGRRENVKDVVTVGVADSALRLSEPQSATVLVEIWPAPIERELSAVPIRWRNLGAGLRAQVSPSVATVSIRGRREALADIRADSIAAFVDLAGLGAGRYNLRVQIDPVERFGVSAVKPNIVEVAIR